MTETSKYKTKEDLVAAYDRFLLEKSGLNAQEKTYSEKEYKRHGDSLYEIGKASAFQSVLKTQVHWSVRMTDDNWDLDTVIIGDGSLKNIPFINTVLTDDKDSDGNYIRKNVITKAKDGTVKEVWLAADRAYKKARRLYGDWHYFLEIVELKTDSCRRKDGYIASFYGS
tara:strand:+ start:5028 stop:5534 length:507 start_codon:yes stop_codon:yes gene_type:complete